jgi:hypothetical protein
MAIDPNQPISGPSDFIQNADGSCTWVRNLDVLNAYNLAAEVASQLAILVAQQTAKAIAAISATGAPNVYNAAGQQQTGATEHTVIDTATLGTGGTATVTLSGSAAFTGAGTYVVDAVDAAAKKPVTVVQNSGSSFTISGGKQGDVVSFICIGT